MKIIGVMRVCNEFVEEVNLTIGSLAAFCDGICFLKHFVTNSIVLDAIDKCDNILEVSEFLVSKYNHCDTVDAAYHLADKFEPDWIIMQDQDELLPFIHLKESLEIADQEGSDVIAVYPINCWETPNRIVHPKLNKTDPHCRGYKGGNKNFTTYGSIGGGIPIDAHQFTFCDYPYRHMHMMTKSCRDRRKSTNCYRTKEEPWSTNEEMPPPTYYYRPDWSLDKWNSL